MLLKNAWKKIVSLISPPQLFVIGFGTLILLGALFLTLPISTRDGQGLSFINALFTSTSATCVTGLVVVDTGTTFSHFGQLVILGLIQVGGLGFMTVASLFVLILGKRISLRQRLLIQESLNHLSVGGIIRLIRHVILFTVIFEGLGTLILGLHWAPAMGWGRALYYGLFHSVSNFNNAGFDLVGNFKSLTPYVDDPVVNIVIMLLIIAGGIGFVVIDELVEYFQRKTEKLSLHTKIVLTTNAVLIFGGALLILLIEFNNPKTLLSLNWTGKILSSFFQSVCARTDGANTLPIGDMHQASLLLIIILMFIGASPGSTGGGVKTTTFAALLGAIWSMIRGQGDVVFYKQRIGQEKVYKALTIVFAALMLVIIVTMILSITEKANVFMILFETTSAFGTVGLSMGLTPHLTSFGRLLLSFVMFAGRVGPLTIAFALTWDRNKKHYRYSEGKIIIG
jgi:trk system potassium uptake protein